MLAIAGGKGGCGKTTTTLGLARAMARAGREPLVVDADCDMPDIHHVADIERNDGTDLVADGTRLEQATQRSGKFPGVALLTAGSPDQVDTALEATVRWHGPVLVDCPAGVSPDATRPLRHATATLLVSTDEPQCLEDARRTATVTAQLETPPIGAIVREITGRAPDEIGPCQVRAVVPSVEAVYDSPPLSRAWQSVSDSILDGLNRNPRRISL